MIEDPREQVFQKGVSVIISVHNGAGNLERLLQSFLVKNTHRPIEIIVVDQAANYYIEKVVEKHAEEAFFVYIKIKKNCSFAVSNNYAAQKAVYPNLLFLGSAIAYTEDFLPWALRKLSEPGTAAVGGYADQNHRQPVSERSIDSEDEVVAIKPAEAGKEEIQVYKKRFFFLCRKNDFKAVSGLPEHSEDGFEFVDFCLRLRKKLDKESYFTDPYFMSMLLAWLENSRCNKQLHE